MSDQTVRMSDLTVRERLLEVQHELKVEKSQWNDFSKFSYRSKEDILEAAKPLCHVRGLTVCCDDEAICLDGWHYVRSVASVTDALTGEAVSASGLAREPESKKGMDASQITGTASSYAGKRALGNLFAIDDTADPDVPATPAARAAQAPSSGPFVARCRSCGTAYQFKDAVQYEAFVSQVACCPSPDWQVE
ncbi:ERF family protein [Olsenella uli]|uniref:ERF family protein n=1 Tax=Olsenella uli TaxID=133926 RepID=UPI0028ECCF61|nr:ERF family protein [Olsenella uli]